ncbi:putative DNA factor subunit beta [Apostichopus japonicus]|uniref:Putative DNA factor subunit beta n=1 Tax=Stichopus japonicus TaxID=307972 RepID=A0A2G8L4J4_STIJA|nr:putative DNA factor subunit beta [Apostichopus japonicus]
MATNYTKTPYKVQKLGGTKKYGVMAGTFEELKAEGCKHLELQSNEIEITLEDNTIVDTGYFQSLKPDTLLIFESKHSEDIVNDLLKNFEDCISRQPDMLTDRLKKNAKLAKFIQVFNEEKGGNMKEDREDDEEWFKDVPKNYKTKSEYMRCKALRRTRKYFNDTKYRLLHSDANDDPEMRERKNEVINNFESKLKENRWYDKRFDRTADGNQKLCNNDGKFNCQGAYNRDSCPHSHHHINPYLRKDYLIEFSSWNLDHQIEKGREVWPQLEKAAEDPLRRVDWDYFYRLLFTMENLKLVHTACHDKMDHQLRVDMTKVFLPV